MVQFNKPPIGLTSKLLHDYDRLLMILEAIERYNKANVIIPQEWLDELFELRTGEAGKMAKERGMDN